MQNFFDEIFIVERYRWKDEKTRIKFDFFKFSSKCNLISEIKRRIELFIVLSFFLFFFQNFNKFRFQYQRIQLLDFFLFFFFVCSRIAQRDKFNQSPHLRLGIQPGRQAHTQEPTVLMQSCSHPPLFHAHSFISNQKQL